MAPDDLVLSNCTPPSRTPLGAPGSAGPSVPGPRDSFSSPSPGAQALRLAPERAEFLAMGLPQSVVSTLQGARAPSTRAAYSYRWEMFQSWCDSRLDPLSCRAHDILQFLQGMLEEGKPPSTLRGMVAAMKAARVGLWKLAEGCCDLIAQFLKGARRLLPTTEGQRDLEVVPSALQHKPFEPLEMVGLKWLSLKSGRAPCPFGACGMLPFLARGCWGGAAPKPCIPPYGLVRVPCQPKY